MKLVIAVTIAALALSGCETVPVEPARATAQLQPTKGNKTFGEATFEEIGGKVRVLVNVQGLKPGQDHGLHIHEIGDCSSADAMSAGGHFNPHKKPHGHYASAERHAGDLPAIRSEKDGRGKVTVEVDAITVSPGPASIVGRSLVVHADPDDYKTQPTGNSGARIACGVIQPG